MANSLEVRCPFLDHRVVECAAAMPGGFKLAPGAGKRVKTHATRP
jgi:asparagine synthetase B (glutamine-hydrolysing)